MAMFHGTSLLDAVETMLAFHENTENIKEIIKRRSNCSISTDQAEEIMICLRNGHSWLTAARKADPVIAPDLMFYSMTNFVKAIALSRGMPKELKDMEKRHGLNEFRQGEARIENIAVKIADCGVFKHLIDATHDRQFFSFRRIGEELSTTLFAVSANIDALKGRTFSLKPLFTRVPGLAPLFVETFCEPPEVERVDVQCRSDEYKLSVINCFHKKSAPNAINEKFPVLKNWPALAKKNIDEAKFPMAFHPGAGSYVMSPMDGLVLSEIAIFYLAGFICSIAARYYPQIWHRAVTQLAPRDSGVGDIRFVPLIQEFQRICAVRFPVLTIEFIRNEYTWLHWPGAFSI